VKKHRKTLDNLREWNLIVFDNLVQADNFITGDTIPVKIRRKHVKKPTHTELYCPTNLKNVKARAKSSANTFKRTFGKIKI
jgi:hypothetical protein